MKIVVEIEIDEKAGDVKTVKVDGKEVPSEPGMNNSQWTPYNNVKHAWSVVMETLYE